MGESFTLEQLAYEVTGGNLAAMAKLLNDAGATPRLDENEPDAEAAVSFETILRLVAMRAGDRVGRVLGSWLEAIRAELGD